MNENSDDKPRAGKFDPANIPRRKSVAVRSEQSQQVDRPAKPKPKPERSPLLGKLKAAITGSSMFERHQIRQDTYTTQVKSENVSAKTELARKHQELAEAEKRRLQSVVEHEAVKDDTDDIANITGGLVDAIARCHCSN